MNKKNSFIENVSLRFENDINTHNLHEGDQYYTTSEAAAAFNISRETARKAMQLLASKNILLRYQRKGTFIGPAAGKREKNSQHECVIFLEPTPLRWSLPPSYIIPTILDQAMPKTDIRVHILPTNRNTTHIKNLLDPLINTKQLDGIITTSRSKEAYEYFHNLDIPVILLGTLDYDMPDLQTIDLDYYQSGFLLAKHLIKNGHQRILAQLRHDFGGGNRLISGILDAMSEANLPPNALIFRIFNGDHATAYPSFQDLFKEKGPHPTAIITESSTLAYIAKDVIKTAGLTVGKDVEITYSGNTVKEHNILPYAHTVPIYSAQELAKLIADTLRQLRENIPTENKHILIPTKLNSGNYRNLLLQHF